MKLEDFHWEQEISLQGSGPGPMLLAFPLSRSVSTPGDSHPSPGALSPGAETREVYERADLELLVLEEYLTVLPQGTQIWLRQNTQKVEKRQCLEDLQKPEDGGCR